MKITKAKYLIEFTDSEKKAITTICNIAESLYNDNLCTDLKCENCPLYNSFCLFGSDDSKINAVRRKLENFINGTD